jgi:ABC-type lipoprotein export system ATPase subunit
MALNGYDGSGATTLILTVESLLRGATKDKARSEKCEGGRRSDEQLREVGTEVTRIIARSSP